MFIDFKEMVSNTEEVIEEVLDFVGADPNRFHYKELPPGMKTEYKGRRIHPTAKSRLVEYFQESNTKLYNMLDRDFHWHDIEN